MLEDIRTALQQTLNELGLKKGIENLKVLSCWEEIVGDKIAQHAQAYRVKKDTLFVTTSSPVWAQELSLIKKDLVSKINKYLRQEKIRDIRFLPRGITSKGENSLADTAQDLNKTALTKKEKKKIEETVEQLEEGQLKEGLKRILMSDRKYKKQHKK